MNVSGHEHHSLIAQVSALTLYGLFGYCAWVVCRNGWRKRRVAQASDVMVVMVEGMTCGGCSGRLTKVLERADGVREAVVSHENGTARVSGDIALEDVHVLIEQAGFDVVEPS